MGAVESFLNAQDKAFRHTVNVARTPEYLKQQKLQNILMEQSTATNNFEIRALERQEKSIIYRDKLTQDHESKLDSLQEDFMRHTQLTDPQEIVDSARSNLHKYFIYSQTGHPTSQQFQNTLQLFAKDAQVAQKSLESMREAEMKRIEELNKGIGKAQGAFAGEQIIAANTDTYDSYQDAAQQLEATRKQIPSFTGTVEPIGNKFRISQASVSPLRGTDGATSEQVQVGVDDQNRPIYAVPGERTTAVKSYLDRDMENKKVALNQLANISNMDLEDIVGAEGMFKRVVFDRMLAQISEGFADGERISNRAEYVRFVESNLKALLNDERISNMDVPRARAFLSDPNTIFESAANVRWTLRTIAKGLLEEYDIKRISLDPTKGSIVTDPEELRRAILQKEINPNIGMLAIEIFHKDFKPSNNNK